MTKLRSLLPRLRWSSPQCAVPRCSGAYSSRSRFPAVSIPGVYFTLRRMSLGRRIELACAVRDLLARLEFHEAGKSLDDQVNAALLSAEVDVVYLRWGLVSLEGLTIDAQPASCEELIAAAPENLAREIVTRIKNECGLSEQETKN